MPLTVWTFVDKVMSLLLHTLSRFVIAFLQRSKCLLISRLQSPSTVIFEPRMSKNCFNSYFIVNIVVFSTHCATCVLKDVFEEGVL